jgi:predicted transcriptional regulator
LNASVTRTNRREQIMAYICDYAGDRNGPTPSINEISKSLGWTYSVVYHHVMKLIIDGKLEQRDGKLCVIGSEWYPPETY